MKRQMLTAVDGVTTKRRYIDFDEAVFLFNFVENGLQFSLYLTQFGRWVIKSEKNDCIGYTTINTLVESQHMLDENKTTYEKVSATLHSIILTDQQNKNRVKACERLLVSLEGDEF